MKCYISVVCVLSAFVAVTLAAPTTLENSELVSVHNQVKRQADNSEALNRVISYSNEKLAQLRRLCPQLFQVIDAVIQNVTSQVFRVVGGALLRSGGLGGGGGGGSSGGSGGGRVSVVLPTFPPDEDEDDDDDDDDDDATEDDVDLRTRIGGSANSTTTTSTSSAAVALSADIIASTESNEIGGNSDDRSSSTTTTRVAASTETESTTTSTTPNPPFTSPSLTQDNTVKRYIRIPRSAEEDQDAAASGGNGPDPASDLSNVDEDDDADRNKRLVPPFGIDAHAAGGSGNFLFDLIRLVAGSGGTEESDEKSAGVGGVAEVDIAPKSTEGIPGPITRLLVIANRGIANLIQDLILRLAQTSERIVNFKARLVTALI